MKKETREKSKKLKRYRFRSFNSFSVKVEVKNKLWILLKHVRYIFRSVKNNTYPLTPASRLTYTVSFTSLTITISNDEIYWDWEFPVKFWRISDIGAEHCRCSLSFTNTRVIPTSDIYLYLWFFGIRILRAFLNISIEFKNHHFHYVYYSVYSPFEWHCLCSVMSRIKFSIFSRILHIWFFRQ